ncbi:MAG: CHASE2 domain-containing protein [Oligoflexia bacterium]|nr:CHASE2 domain-containing protein [Oligoflexia bacterium]
MNWKIAMWARNDEVAFEVRWKWFYPLLRCAGAVLIAVVLHRFPLSYLEGVLYDWRVRLSPGLTPSGIVTTVAVDPKTLSVLRGEPNTEDFTQTVEQLSSDNPRAIIFLADPSQWEGSLDSKVKFSQVASRATNLFFASEQLAPLSQYSHIQLPKPFDALNVASAPITRDNVTFAGDKVTRRMLIAFENQLVLQPLLANLSNKIINPLQYRGAFESDGSVFGYIRFSPPGTIKPLSFGDVKEGRFPKGTFTDRIVIIGHDTQMDTDDYIMTPYSRQPLSMSRLEAQAQIFENLVQNVGIIKSPDLANLTITIVVACVTVIIVWTGTPIQGILALLGQAISVIGLAYILQAFGGIWISLIHPLLAIFVSYYFFIPYRLIVENRKSWEFQQRNTLLEQVEELKSNFMSMMSHDLKTPIARIQGMAELALRSETKLDSQQKEALKSIMKSSDELGQFVGSILDLSRIESKEVKLNKSSRDINSIVKEVIKKYEFNAKSKNIKIKSELEPLFSIKFDVDLMRQVIGNLVENAIKYTPENSEIVVATKESGGNIQVAVRDQGPGIAQDEVDNIFLKFYRGKTAKASPIKGTGLGLYLAKYFVELHQGKISVNSKPNEGSTFTVELPV